MDSDISVLRKKAAIYDLTVMAADHQKAMQQALRSIPALESELSELLANRENDTDNQDKSE